MKSVHITLSGAAKPEPRSFDAVVMIRLITLIAVDHLMPLHHDFFALRSCC